MAKSTQISLRLWALRNIWVTVWNHLQQHLAHASFVGLNTDLCTPCDHAALRRLHRAARCRHFSWKMKCCCSLSQRDCWEGLKNEGGGKHGNVSSDSTSQGTLTSSSETKIKIPFLLPSQHNRKMGSGGQWSLFLFAPDGCFLTAQSFCSVKIRGHCCALQSCQTLYVSHDDAPRWGVNITERTIHHHHHHWGAVVRGKLPPLWCFTHFAGFLLQLTCTHTHNNTFSVQSSVWMYMQVRVTQRN